MTSDPFGTAGLRDAVLAAWTGHPGRFREDANAEEDHAHGYYRDRVVVELAQNAADAAARSGRPGRLLLRLTAGPAGATLLAANTGAPLDGEGVASLASLRASAKRDEGGAVGRFGVGFAAVRSVSDEVVVASGSGAVAFSLDRTRSLLASAGAELAAEVERRGDSLPALRLPFEASADGVVPAGYDTAVVLDLRDAAAVDRVRVQLAAVGDALLLALPALEGVVVDVDGVVRTVEEVDARWVVATRTGRLDARLLADRPVEERGRDGWQVTWAAPRDPAAVTFPAVVHAPTPTDEPCTLPVLLVATFPLDPSRRHVAPGPLTDAVVALAADVWADLLLRCRDERAAPSGDRPAAPDPLDLLPSGLAAGALDAALRTAVVAVSREVPLLAPLGGGRAVAASEAVVLDGVGPGAAAGRVLGTWMPQLVVPEPRHRRLVPLLRIATTEVADVVDAVPVAAPGDLRGLYEAFADADAPMLEQLATLPVPLADGRTVRGARGAVLTDPGVAPATVQRLAAWGLRAVHPDAAHPLLERLGAVRADAAALLRHPVLRHQVLDADADDDDGTCEEVAEVVLGLVRSAGSDAGEPEPWWGELLLPAADGELLPAAGLVVPGSPAARWFDPAVLPPLAEHVADRWADAVEVVGCRAGLRTVRVPAEDVDDVADEDRDLRTEALDGWADYLEELADAAGHDPVPELLAVADLDAVRDDVWAQVLPELVRGETRRAVVQPVRVGGTTAPSYTAWWLRRRADLGLDRPFALRPGGGGALAALLPDPPRLLEGLDPEVLRALGGVDTAEDLDADAWGDLLDGLPPAGAQVDVALAVAVWRGLAGYAERHPDAGPLDVDRLPALTAPADVQAASAGGDRAPTPTDVLVVVPVDEVAVATPLWAQHPSVRPVVVAPDDAAASLADLLDVDLAAERETGRVTSRGAEASVPSAVASVFPDAPHRWHRHDDLRVDGMPVDWWVEDRGLQRVVHAATTGGLARALAHTVGWAHRDTLLRLLLTPADADAVLVETAGEPAPDEPAQVEPAHGTPTRYEGDR